MNSFYNNCIFYDENNNLNNSFKNVEDGTRFLINKYIKPNMNVLELGARYGTVSVCLDFILNDPKKQLLCVDPDTTIKYCLEKNKNINNCSFNIFNGAISNNELYVCYNGCIWETKTYINPPDNLNSEKISTLSIDKIQEIYNIHFNSLVADCEGFLLQFIEENPSFFDNLICVIYEEDCCKNHPINNDFIDYTIIETFLINKGFILTETYLDNIGLNNKVWLKKNMDNNFHIFIASCYEGLNIQIPRLIDNILKSNIPPEYVHFIVGGCPNEDIYFINNIQIILVKYRCFEFTPHIFIVNNPDFFDFDYAFFTHDTVNFGPGFYNIIKNDILHLKNNNFDTMTIDNSLPSMNIGIYSKNIILQNTSTLQSLSLNSNDYNQLYELKRNLVNFEDFLFKFNNYYNDNSVVENINTVFTGINNTVANGFTRIFKRIDFIKYQSNAHSIQSIDICKI
jgi:FkbM family methyltransferase